MRTIAGIDTSYDGRRYATALVIFSGEKIDSIKTDEGEITTPYVSKLFFLREAPILSRLLFGQTIDLLFVNGHGVCHPYFFGLATVVGWTHNMRTIGVASRLIKGEYDRLPSSDPSIDFVMLRGRVIGAAVRRKHGSKPLFVSQGFGVSLDTAIREYLVWSMHGRVPEPLRLAHLRSRALLRERRRIEIKPDFV